MKKIFATGLCVSVLTLAGSVYAFEMPSAIKGVASTVSSLTPSNARGAVATINTKLATADAALQNAFETLVSALSSAEESAEIKSKIETIRSNKDLSEAEQSAKIAEIISDYGTALKEEQADLTEQLKAANEEKRTKIGDAISNLVVVGYQYLDIASDCKSLTMSITANPTLAIALVPEVASLKNTGIMLKSNLVSLKNVTTQAITVARAGGVNVNIPKNTSSKAKQVDLSDID